MGALAPTLLVVGLVWAGVGTTLASAGLRNDTQLYLRVVTACRAGGEACQKASVAAVDAARHQEGLGSLRLPSMFWSLPYDQQTLIVVDEERVSRRLRPLTGVTAALNNSSLLAAQAGTDPMYSGRADWGANQGIAPNVVFADFEYMYDDGLGSGNADCTSAHPQGCWGHRGNILYRWPRVGGWRLQLGAACTTDYAEPQGFPELICTILVVDGPSRGGYVYTWARARRATKSAMS